MKMAELLSTHLHFTIFIITQIVLQTCTYSNCHSVDTYLYVLINILLPEVLKNPKKQKTECQSEDSRAPDKKR